MSDYESFFTDRAIIKALCKRRMAFCRKVREREFLNKISYKERNGANKILDYMPPRARWLQADKIRSEKPNSHRQYSKDLEYTIVKLRSESDDKDRSWILAQNNLIKKIKSKALFDASPKSLIKPQINAVPKNKTEYRIIADYNDCLADSIIIQQCANYLRRNFDSYFLTCSFAFRSPPAKKPEDHHGAFVKLNEFWGANMNNGQINAYVAECDIQGFYDIVDHKIILDCYDEAVLELEEKSSICIDKRARQIICAYLDSYTYNNVREELISKNPQIQIKNRDCTLKSKNYWYSNIKYGLPQGGALSVFFANLILHKADIAVTELLNENSNSLYIRYCDDMVIVTLSKQLTQKALETYLGKLDELHLVPHEPTNVESYSKKFWETKSKATYLWNKDLIPWLSFVGYQLRNDGMVRIRKASLEKELEKQINTRKKFLNRIKTAIKEKVILGSDRKLLASLEGRLRAAAIGKRPKRDLSIGMEESDFGWCKGFKELASEHLSQNQSIAQGQLRSLDRGLRKQLAITKNRLKRLESLERKSDAHNDNPKHRLKFNGKPRSYAGQLSKTP